MKSKAKQSSSKKGSTQDPYYKSLEERMDTFERAYDTLLYHVKLLATGVIERNVEMKRSRGKPGK